MRYLGLSLGMGAALGYCAAFGTLLPPIAKSIDASLPIGGPTLDAIAASTAGRITLAGVGICLVGILISGLARAVRNTAVLAIFCALFCHNLYWFALLWFAALAARLAGCRLRLMAANDTGYPSHH
jgi:hypothetical protein